MNCPICNSELDIMKGISDSVLGCPKCLHIATRGLWESLDIAVDALKRLDKELYFNNAKQTGHITDSVAQIPGIALEQIISLEQIEQKD